MPIIGAIPPPPQTTGTLPAGTQFSPITVDLGPLTFGVVDDAGVEWYCSTLDGWDDEPDIVAAVTARPDDHGSWSGPAYLAPRTVTLEGWIVAPSEPARDAALDALGAAATLTPTTLLRVDGNPSRQVYVRRSGKINKARFGPQIAQIQVPLLAPDPRRYATNLPTYHTTLPGSSGGLTLPFTLPATLPDQLTSGSVAGTQTGNMDAPWVARIDGPIDNPRLSLLTTGEVLALQTSLGAGDYLMLDARYRTVTLNAVADRSGALTTDSAWWRVSPGPWQVGFAGTATDSVLAPQLTLTVLDCWS